MKQRSVRKSLNPKSNQYFIKTKIPFEIRCIPLLPRQVCVRIRLVQVRIHHFFLWTLFIFFFLQVLLARVSITRKRQRIESVMATTVDTVGEPIPTSAVLMASSKHISTKCRMENMDFLNCKKKDANPDKCLDKGQEVTRCVLSLLKGLHQNCTKEMDAYAGCMYYHTNEFDLCRKEQQAFEKACPWNE